MTSEPGETTGAGEPVAVTLGPDEAVVLLDWLMRVDLESVAFGTPSEKQALLGLLLQLDEQVDAAARTGATIEGARGRLAQIQTEMDRDADRRSEPSLPSDSENVTEVPNPDHRAARRGREQNPSPPYSEKGTPPGDPNSDETLTLAAELLDDPQSLQDTMQKMVEVAKDSLREIDHAGITLTGPDAGDTAAATDDFVRELDRVQYALGQGPSLFELEHHEPVTVVEFVAQGDNRWPRFAGEAAQMGLRSMMALRLSRNDTTLGVFNLYSTSHDTIDHDTRAVALMFARHASIAYSNSRMTSNLQIALETQELVGQAVGVVMERYQLDAAKAFTYLARVSSTTNTEIRDVARDIIEHVEASNRSGVTEDA